MGTAMTATEIEVTPKLSEPGDSEKFAHYVNKDKIVEASVYGSLVTALCGKSWVPTRDPKNYPVCLDCQRLFELGPEGRMREWKERAERS